MAIVSTVNKLSTLWGIREWSIYHRIMLMFLLSAIVAISYQFAYAAQDGSYQVKRATVIDAPAESVWSLIVDTENRRRWHAQIIRIDRFKDNPAVLGSTRLLSWRNMNRRTWTAFEETIGLVPGLFYQTYQKSDRDERSFSITLDPLGACRTRVILEEVIRPLAYGNRVTAPFQKRRDIERFEQSFKGLKRWAQPGSDCEKRAVIVKKP